MKGSKLLHVASAIALTSTALFTSGCSMFRASATEVDVSQTKHYDAEFDYSDLRKTTDDMTSDLLASRWLGEMPEAPVMMIAGIQNRTAEYIDTRALADRIRSLTFETGKIRYVNESRREDLLKEQGFQAEHATASSQVAVGKQLGASHMMSGSLVEMRKKEQEQVRVSKKKLIYYKFTLEITDLESGELVWTKDQEFAREESKPIIGW